MLKDRVEELFWWFGSHHLYSGVPFGEIQLHFLPSEYRPRLAMAIPEPPSIQFYPDAIAMPGAPPLEMIVGHELAHFVLPQLPESAWRRWMTICHTYPTLLVEPGVRAKYREAFCMALPRVALGIAVIPEVENFILSL